MNHEEQIAEEARKIKESLGANATPPQMNLKVTVRFISGGNEKIINTNFFPSENGSYTYVRHRLKDGRETGITLLLTHDVKFLDVSVIE